MVRRLVFGCILALSVPVLASASAPDLTSTAPDTPEPGSSEAIAKFTTEARFGNPWIAYVPDSAKVPSPSKYLGHVAGAAGELSRTAQIYGYFRALAFFHRSRPRIPSSSAIATSRMSRPSSDFPMTSTLTRGVAFASARK